MKKTIKKSNIVRTSAIVGGVSLATILNSSAATVLTGAGGANDDPVPTAHGSNEVGTPNIKLTWGGTWQSYTNWNARGDVYQLDSAAAGTVFTVAFAADTGFKTILNKADLDVWSGSVGDFVINWNISGSTSGSLGNDQVTLADGSARTSINFGGLTGADGEILTLTLAMDGTSAGRGGYLAMDNLSFDQVASVPEPSSSLLAVVGLGAMAMRRRRK